jgi:chromosome segregation ATPase
LTLLAEVGRGNKGTICKHYATLKAEDAPAASGMPPPISPALLGEIAHEIESQVKARTTGLSSELEDVQKTLEAVAAESEAFSADASEAESRANAFQLSLAEQAGVIEELRAQNRSLSTQLSSLSDDAERARQALALAQENLRASEDRVARLEADNDRTRIEVSDVRAECTKLREQLEARTHECISLRANAETGREVAASVEQALARTELLQTNLEEARSRLASSEAQRQGLAERLKDAQGALSRAEATCERLLQKVLQHGTDALEPDDSHHRHDLVRGL